MNRESKSRIGMIASLLGAMAAAGVAGWLVLKYALPQYYFGLYPAVPLYFTVLGAAMSIVMWVYGRRAAARRMVNVYMIMRGVKLLLTLAGIFLYYRLVGEQMVEFGLTVAAFYFIYLFVETYLFYRFEKINKQVR